MHPWITCDLSVTLPEEVLPEVHVPKVINREHRRLEELKRTAVIPKRLEKEKLQLLEELKNLGSKRKVHHS